MTTTSTTAEDRLTQLGIHLPEAAIPRLLVLWGKYDLSFELTEPEAYRSDVPKAQVHVLEAGHFALATAADEIAELVRRFMSNEE